MAAAAPLRGPYTLWHHTHTFEDRDGGTLCGDFVRYRPRGGALVHWLFVRRDVERIFQYRQQRLRERFGTAFDRDGVPTTRCAQRKPTPKVDAW